MPRGKGQTPSDEDFARRRAFAKALGTVAREDNLSQAELARRLGLAQQTVSKYIAGQLPPENPHIVFEMERSLGLPPGYLSNHLGYVPVGAPDTPTAILNDRGLIPETRQMLLQVYRDFLAASRILAESEQRDLNRRRRKSE
jgi:transcriptional regulator with XRE-family HTH domain